MKKHYYILLICICLPLLLHTSELEVTRQLIKQAGTYYAGRYYDESITILERLHRKHPDSGLIKIFLAHCYFSKGFEAFWPWKKSEWANKGIALMNEAVEKEPDNLFLRIERFKAFTWLPSHYKTAQIGFNDVPILITQIDNFIFDQIKNDFEIWDSFLQYNPYQPDEQRLKVFLKQMVLCHAGDKYYALGDNENARIMMEQAEKLGTDLYYGIYAYSWLERNGYKDTKK